MARARTKPVVVEDDGLDQVITIDQDTWLEDYPPELLRVLTGFNGFNGWAQLIEEAWAPIAKASPDDVRVRGYSRVAYAHRLLWHMRRLTRVLAQKDLAGLTRRELEGLLMLAVRVGYDWADAKWRFNRGRLTRTGAKRVQGYADSGRKSGATRRAKTHPAIIDMAHELRTIHPHGRRYSTRWLASRIAKVLKRPVGTVRDVLRTHQIT